MFIGVNFKRFETIGFFDNQDLLIYYINQKGQKDYLKKGEVAYSKKVMVEIQNNATEITLKEKRF
jgi:hypothetical protein